MSAPNTPKPKPTKSLSDYTIEDDTYNEALSKEHSKELLDSLIVVTTILKFISPSKRVEMLELLFEGYCTNCGSEACTTCGSPDPYQLDS